MKKEAKLLLKKALDSLVLSVDHFNRHWNQGRAEAVLILLDRAFELILKASIVHKNGRIREARAKETIGFDKCVRKCLTDAQVQCLTNDETVTLQVINSLRDAAQHYILDISEEQLYIYAQAGTTLFGELLERVFARKLSDYIPERVLPISATPPKDLHAVIAAEFEDIKRLMAPGSRRWVQARAKLRALAIAESALAGERLQPGEGELNKLLREIRGGREWTDLFPGVASLELAPAGSGFAVSIRLSKKEGEPVRLVPEGTPGALVIALKRVGELGYYSLGLKDLAEHLKISMPRALAVIQELELQNDEKYFKLMKIGKITAKRYSHEALKRMTEELLKLDMAVVWAKWKPTGKKKSRDLARQGA